MSFNDAHAFAFSLATSLMAVIVIFRAGDGTLSVTPWRAAGSERGPLLVQALAAVMPQRASAASSLTRASTQRAPWGVCSFFQKGAWVLR